MCPECTKGRTDANTVAQGTPVVPCIWKEMQWVQKAEPLRGSMQFDVATTARPARQENDTQC